MAAPSLPTTDRPKAHLPLGGYLFTPPENTVHSFSHQDEEPDNDHYVDKWRIHVGGQAQQTLPPLVRTPPASPHTNALPSIASATGYGVHDSPLFPRQGSIESAQAERPLFDRSSSLAPTETTEPPKPLHTLELPPNNPQPRSKIFPFSLNITTGEEALAYFRRCQGEIKSMGRKLPEPKTSPDHRLIPEDVRQLHSLIRAAGVTKPRSAPRNPSKPKAPVATSSLKPTPRKSRAAPKPRSTYNDFVDTAFPPREASTKHKRAPASKKVEDKNWTELTDYAPPVSDLDTNPKTLKVTWHGSPKQLADDPDRAQLHEQELQIASMLRLDCATYLTNKRKIFQAKLQTLKDGKNFTKTAAQNACAVDVNKASQLWEAFDRVGWFRPDWFATWL